MSNKHITIEQLIFIEKYYIEGLTGREAARRLRIGKDKVLHYFKQLKANKSTSEIYNQYKRNKQKCGRKKIQLSQRKLEDIEKKLNNDWSIDAICGRDKREKQLERVCTKTLYRIVKSKPKLKRLLRRSGRKGRKQEETRGKLNTGKTIHQRNESYQITQEFGHYEGDTIVGEKRQSAIVTLVEKQSKKIVLRKASRKSEDVLNGIQTWLEESPIVKTITFDRGKEFSKWEEMEKRAEIEIYFSDPGRPGQRGLNENSNGIIRKDFPKKTDLSKYSQEELDIIAEKWNNIPRKILGYLTPNEKYNELAKLEIISTV